MAHDLEAEGAVNLSYAEPKRQRYVSVTGNASVVRDRAKIEELWAPLMKTYFPRGLEDPHLMLLCVRIESAEYWDSPSSKVVQLFKGADHGEHTKIDVRAARASG